MVNSDFDDFMSDPLFGYRNDLLSPFSLQSSMADYEGICAIANTIESVIDPYEASRLAVAVSKKVKINNFMKVISSTSIKRDTLTDNRFRQIENRVILGVEKTDGISLTCCRPGCTNPAIKRSHSLQKKGVLEKIANKDNEVYQTKITAFSGSNFMQKIGWNNASTFPGFCRNCEQTLFLNAERRDAEANVDNLEILIWRALCYTRFRRAQELQMRGHIVSKPDAYALSRDLDDVLVIASSALLFKSRIHSFRMIDNWVKSLERKLGYGKGRHYYLILKAPELPFVGAGIIPLYYDFDRNRIQPSDKFNSYTQSCAYTTCVIDGSVHLVICAQRSERKAVSFLMDMYRMDKQLLSSFIPQIIMGSSDTVYFSTDYWDHESSDLDKHIFKHAYFMNISQMLFPFWGAPSKINIESTRLL